MRITCEEYENRKEEFLKKHGGWSVETSPFENEGYRKFYTCDDGARWYEVNDAVFEHASAIVQVKGVEVILEEDVKLLRTEGWSSDNATSIFCYERF